MVLNAIGKKLGRGDTAVVQMGSMASLEHGVTCSIPSLAQWVKDSVLLQLQHRLQLWFGSDHQSRNSVCRRTQKRKTKKLGRKGARKRWEFASLNRRIGESFSVNTTFESISEGDEITPGGKVFPIRDCS